jgi:hypothetical protein
MSCSEGDTKSALGEGPKVFMLAAATSVIRCFSYILESPVRAATLAGPVFLLLLLTLIIGNYY